VALSALFRLRARGVTPRAIALFSPWTDLALTGWSVVARGLTADSPYAMEMIALSSHFYLQGTASPVDPLASPAYGDLAGLPPILIHTSKTDILHDDAATLARRAADAGVETTLRIWPHGAHVFERYAGPESDRSIAEAARFLRGRLGLSQAA
jgi:acetyl esterase/lipase